MSIKPANRIVPRFAPNRGRRGKSPLFLAVGLVLVCAVILIFAAIGTLDALSGDQNAQGSSLGAAETELPDESTELASAGVKDPESQSAGIVVCLDAGHGGHDPGTNTAERLEKDDNLRLALAVKEAMEQKGIEVVLTREDDTFVALDERCSIANQSGADYFISLHRNAAGGVGKGVEVWKAADADEQSSLLADNVNAGLDTVGVSKNRGVRQGSQDSEASDYYVLRETAMPSILIEMGFIEVEEDNQLFEQNLTAYAEAIAQAVLDTYAAKE